LKVSGTQPEDFLRRLSSWLNDLAREVGRLRFKFATGAGAPSERIHKLVQDADKHLDHYLDDSRHIGQHVLNPAEAATSVPGKRTLDPAIVKKRSRRFVPDAHHTGDAFDKHRLQPGDLILLSHVHQRPVNPGNTGPALPQAARRVNKDLYGFPWAHAHWHHAMIYLGNGRVMDTDLKGVREKDFYEDYGGSGSYLIRARRCKHLHRFKRKQMALESRYWQDTKYLYDIESAALAIEFLDAPPHSLLDRYVYARPQDVMVTVCSQVCAVNYAHHSGRWVRSKLSPDSYITPAALSASEHLEDVELRWVEVV
jgi:cell wall-associated NlpC family hydrolase